MLAITQQWKTLKPNRAHNDIKTPDGYQVGSCQKPKNRGENAVSRVCIIAASLNRKHYAYTTFMEID